MTVYNKSPVVFGVDIYDNNDCLIETRFINAYWYEMEIIHSGVDALISIPNTVTGKPSAMNSEKTDLVFSVPAGGYFVFTTPYDSKHLQIANTVQFVLGILACVGDATCDVQKAWYVLSALKEADAMNTLIQCIQKDDALFAMFWKFILI